jgi:hypothetical protein
VRSTSRSHDASPHEGRWEVRHHNVGEMGEEFLSTVAAVCCTSAVQTVLNRIKGRVMDLDGSRWHDGSNLNCSALVRLVCAIAPMCWCWLSFTSNERWHLNESDAAALTAPSRMMFHCSGEIDCRDRLNCVGTGGTVLAVASTLRF